MTLKAGIDLIKKFEGCHLKAYPDPPSMIFTILSILYVYIILQWII